ncbi:MAG: stage 0 sporulation family protein [Lachnospiraceae bacterium]|nr:stage 0 sporulation family protein [Lachnospiraceae bacterium]
MIQIIGVKFRKPGKVYYFDPIGLTIEKGNHVIVETARGVEYGTVVLGPKEVPDDQIIQPLKPVIRIGTEEDAATNIANEEKEKEAFQICLEKIRKHELEMKLIDSEYTFDRNKLLFYFTADGRIDFRELVKDLASVFHTRIELRQIGVRDETKMIGGIAICGRPLCCHSYLSEFAPVSIKMAKEQNLSLNPAKISGVCGRLMCCLKNEQEAYEDLNRNLPNIGARTTTPEGYHGEVQSVSVLRQLVKVVITNDNGEKEVREYPVSDLTFELQQGNMNTRPKQLLPDEALDEEELIALEELSREEETLESEDEQTRAPQRYGRQNRRRNSNFNNNRGERGSRGEKDDRKRSHNHGDRYGHGSRNEYNSHYHEEQQRPNRGQRRYHNRRPRKDSRDQKDGE